MDGKTIIQKKDKTKNESSWRTYPMIPYIKSRLQAHRENQEYYKDLCGRSYLQENAGYVCVDEIGELLKPDYITWAFPNMLIKNGLRKIRYHDLRHTCVAILMAHGVPLEQIQRWVGHSEIGTTNDIYGHMEFATKLQAAEKMATALFDNPILGQPTWYDEWLQKSAEKAVNAS